MKDGNGEKRWVLCPWCGAKTRLQIQFCSGPFSEKKRQHILTAGFRCFEKGGIKI